MPKGKGYSKKSGETKSGKKVTKTDYRSAKKKKMASGGDMKKKKKKKMS